MPCKRKPSAPSPPVPRQDDALDQIVATWLTALLEQGERASGEIPRPTEAAAGHSTDA